MHLEGRAARAARRGERAAGPARRGAGLGHQHGAGPRSSAPHCGTGDPPCRDPHGLTYSVSFMTVAHPIAHAWLSTGGTGAQNYDEFASDAEITEIIAANPTSALAVEMPHRAPESVGRPFRDCLPDAVSRFASAQRQGRYAPATDIAALYRVSSRDGAAGYGLWCMVDTDQISTSADEPGLVIRNEDVFIDKVHERVALAEAVRALLSPVLLLHTTHGQDLHAALARASAAAGTPAVTDVDPAGRTHEVWGIGPGPVRDELLALAGTGELVVA